MERRNEYGSPITKPVVTKHAGGRHPGTRLPNLRAWREWRMLSQGELARIVGKTLSYISSLETGKNGASINMVRDLAAALEIEPDQLLDERPKTARSPLRVLR